MTLNIPQHNEPSTSSHLHPPTPKIAQEEKPQTSHKFFNRGFTIIRVIFH
jgi:hypothetical protein